MSFFLCLIFFFFKPLSFSLKGRSSSSLQGNSFSFFFNRFIAHMILIVAYDFQLLPFLLFFWKILTLNLFKKKKKILIIRMNHVQLSVDHIDITILINNLPLNLYASAYPHQNFVFYLCAYTPVRVCSVSQRKRERSACTKYGSHKP